MNTHSMHAHAQKAGENRRMGSMGEQCLRDRKIGFTGFFLMPETFGIRWSSMVAQLLTLDLNMRRGVFFLN